MHDINLPPCDFQISTANGQTSIYDVVRKKYVKLTPEEWVRQHVVHFLLKQRNFPATLMGVEVAMEQNQMRRRADIVCYNPQGEVLLVTECKAPDVKITQAVFDQIAHYNIQLKAKYLLVTNGLTHYICKIDVARKTYAFVNEIPDYKTLV